MGVGEADGLSGTIRGSARAPPLSRPRRGGWDSGSGEGLPVTGRPAATHTPLHSTPRPGPWGVRSHTGLCILAGRGRNCSCPVWPSSSNLPVPNFGPCLTFCYGQVTLGPLLERPKPSQPHQVALGIPQSPFGVCRFKLIFLSPFIRVPSTAKLCVCGIVAEY